jgi:hypothetical protein
LRSPVDIHVFAAETFDLGREEIDAGHGIALGLYSAEQSLVDLIRLRHRASVKIDAVPLNAVCAVGELKSTWRFNSLIALGASKDHS